MAMIMFMAIKKEEGKQKKHHSNSTNIKISNSYEKRQINSIKIITVIEIGEAVLNSYIYIPILL